MYKLTNRHIPVVGHVVYPHDLQFQNTGLHYNIDYQFKVGYYQTENLYSEDNFLDISTSLLYNIQN